MPGMVWVTVVAVAVVALLTGYLMWTARRVDRLHVRARSAARALDAHLLRRAAAAAVVAERYAHLELYAAARIALDAEPELREAAENDLTRQLKAQPLDFADATTQTLIATSRRVELARQVHTDLVRDALAVRDRPIVRLLRMARRHPRPTYFDIVEPTMPVEQPRPEVRPPGDGLAIGAPAAPAYDHR
ncbi:MAG TPA: hypothetical protein VFO77_06915 [Actinoplanes sp.]|nr:hypothetical protein [Actinoplanes sp.]